MWMLDGTEFLLCTSLACTGPSTLALGSRVLAQGDLAVVGAGLS